MQDFIRQIEEANNITVSFSRDSKELIILHGQVMEVNAEDDVISIDMDSAEVTINKNWGVIADGDGFIFTCDDGLNMYVDILD